MNQNFISVRRKLPAFELATMGAPVTENQVAMGEWLEVEQCCVLRKGAWTTYLIRREGDWSSELPGKTIGVVPFTTNSEGRPTGIFDLIYKEEIEKFNLDKAIDTRVRRITPAIIIDKSMMNVEDSLGMFQENEVLDVDGSKMVGSILPFSRIIFAKAVRSSGPFLPPHCKPSGSFSNASIKIGNSTPAVLTLSCWSTGLTVRSISTAKPSIFFFLSQDSATCFLASPITSHALSTRYLTLWVDCS